MDRKERQQRIIDYLAVGPQVLEPNTDRLDDLKTILQELSESGDLVALMGVVQHANMLAQRLIEDQARAARRAAREAS